jgi:hypothetical protein
MQHFFCHKKMSLSQYELDRRARMESIRKHFEREFVSTGVLLNADETTKKKKKKKKPELAVEEEELQPVRCSKRLQDEPAVQYFDYAGDELDALDIAFQKRKKKCDARNLRDRTPKPYKKTFEDRQAEDMPVRKHKDKSITPLLRHTVSSVCTGQCQNIFFDPHTNATQICGQPVANSKVLCRECKPTLDTWCENYSRLVNEHVTSEDEEDTSVVDGKWWTASSKVNCPFPNCISTCLKNGNTVLRKHNNLSSRSCPFSARNYSSCAFHVRNLKELHKQGHTLGDADLEHSCRKLALTSLI